MQDDSAKLRGIVDSSPQSSEPIKRHAFTPKYPWSTVPIGKSFVVAHNEMKLTSLRPFANRMGKKFGKKFRVVDHGPEIGYEVACKPMDEQTAIQSSTGIVDTLNKMGEAPTDFGFEKEKE